MNNKVLEIQITDDSPIRIKSLNRHISDWSDAENSNKTPNKNQPLSKHPKKILPEIQIPEDSVSISIKRSPTFEITQNFPETQNKTKEKRETLTKGNPEPQNAVEDFESRWKTIEKQITIEKELYSVKFKELCTTRDSMKKTLLALENGSNLDEIIKNNSKKIVLLRKYTDQSKTELFHMKQRVYKAELEIQSVEHEIETYTKEISELRTKQKQLSINQEEILKNFLVQNEALTQENKDLNERNLEFLSEASELVNDFVSKKEFNY